jgi:fructosamine-3-kinase
MTAPDGGPGGAVGGGGALAGDPIGADPGLAGRIAGLTGAAPAELIPAGSEHEWRNYRVTLADGRAAFVKAAGADLGGIFEAEARGLRWLADAHAVPLPSVLGWDSRTLAVAWVPEQAADRQSAEQFGRDLAVLHAAGAERFGTPWPGFIASLPLGDRSGDTGAGDWASWYADKRLLPYLRRAAGTGTLDGADTRLVEEVTSRITSLAGPPEPPSRIHGDCWSGNVLWSGGRGWLIDPAAQGGHRETDLAMLALFGAPHLDRILAAYQEVAPLAPGWQQRVPLHQLHPLLVHACLFGAAYREPVRATARAALAA